MKRVFSKIICIIIIIGILLTQSMIAFAAESAETTKLKQEQNEINKDKNDAEKELKEIQAEKSEAVKQVEELSDKIADYEEQINTLDNQISELNTKISDSQKELEKAEEDYSNQKELLEARLVATYEAGETSYLDFILSSNGIADLISNYFLVTEVATNDAELLEKIDKKKQEIEVTKNTLEQSKKELATSKASKQSMQTQLQSAKSEKDQKVAKLTDDEKKVQSHIEELRNASSQIEKEIKQAQERYAAQLAELKRKQEEARKKQPNTQTASQNGGSSSSGNYNSGGSGMLQRPVSTGSITATMYYSSGSYHGALDYGIPVGTPVYAAADGVVINTANLSGSYGTYVVIQHTNGIQTWYAHGTPGSICVSAGQTVSRGQLIMKSGNSGNSTGPHLHFEVRVAPYNYSTCRVDPRNYF